MSRIRVNQVSAFSGSTVSIGGLPTQASAALQINSTTGGFLPPILTTTQRDAILLPTEGLMIYNITTGQYEKFNGSAWLGSEGIKSINGLTAFAQLLTNGSAGTAPNWTQTGGNTNVLNIPLASSPAVTAGLISKGDYDSFNVRQYPVTNVRYVTKNSILGPQDFNSIADALNSISGNTALNPFLIQVGPGVFIEQQLQMKSYVSIQGSGGLTTTVVAGNPTNHLFVAAANASLKNLAVTGVTASGKAAVFAPIGIEIDNVFFLGSNIHILAEADTVSVSMLIRGCYLDGVFDKGIVCTNTAPSFNRCLVVVRDSLCIAGTSPAPPTAVVFISGPDCTVISSSLIGSVGGAGGGVGFWVENGGILRATDGQMLNFNTAIYVPNVGLAPNVTVDSAVLESTTFDVNVEHPSAIGAITGSADQSKVAVDDSALVYVSMSDTVTGGIFNTGPLSLGRKVSTLTNVSDLLEGEPGMGIIMGGFLSDNGGFDVGVSAGFGYAQVSPFPNHQIRRIQWPGSTIALGPNQDVYIYLNSSGVITAAASIGNTVDIILIGRVVTNGTDIELIDQSPVLARHGLNFINRVLREGFGSIYDTGSIVTENVTPFKIDITGGVYFYSFNRFTPVGATADVFVQYYKDGVGGYVHTDTDTVNNTDYDDGSGTLVPLTAGYYTAHTVYINCDDADEQYFVVLGQAEYSALAAVESSPLPNPPSWIKDAVTPIARLVIKEGDANIVEVLDIRPVIGFKSSGVSASADHGNLLGLSDDDHMQYLLVTGSRAMAGALNMGANAITNVSTVNGVTVETHTSRHLPSGADPLSTAAPLIAVGGNTTNDVGTANTLSRSDHQHDVATGTPSSQVPNQSNTEGVSNNLARADHIHQLATAAPVANLNANSTNQDGVAATFSRSDHSHDIDTGIAGSVLPNNSNAEGTSPNIARADHSHALPSAAPLTIGTANAIGSANSISRSDHVHSHGAQTDPAQHAVATTSVNGFMSAADKTKLDGLPGTAVPTSRQILAGAGLTGGGDLTADRTISMPNVGTAGTYGSASQVPVFTTDTQGRVSAVVNTSIAILAAAVTDFNSAVLASVLTGYVVGANTILAATDTVLQAFQKIQGQLNARANASITITAGAGLTGGGDLSANRTIDVVANADGSIVVNANDIQVGVLATDAQHGNRGNGSLHTVATTSVAGFMSAADKTKLDGVATGATNTPLASTTPADVTKAAAAIGVSTTAARSDHKHDISTAAPISLTDSTNAEGTATSLARSDHTHAHGTRGGGTLHAQVTTSVDGFMIAADKAKLDNIPLQRNRYGAPDFDSPSTADWPIANIAPLTVDSVNSAVPVRTFLGATTEQGVGIDGIYIPVGTTSLTFRIKWRAQTNGGAGLEWQPSFQVRQLVVDTGWTAWSETDITPIAVAANTNWHESVQTVALSAFTVAIVAGRTIQIEFTREIGDPDDDYTGVVNLYELIIEAIP